MGKAGSDSAGPFGGITSLFDGGEARIWAISTDSLEVSCIANCAAQRSRAYERTQFPTQIYVACLGSAVAI
jgi:hypothetical protein